MRWSGRHFFMLFVFLSSRRRHTRCALVTGVQRVLFRSAAGAADDVDAVEARRAGAVRDRGDLAGLALAVEERAAHAVVALVADRRAGIPELRRADLVGHVLEHPGDLAVLDLVEQLAAELRVVALLVNREGAVADDVDAFLEIGRGSWRRRMG